MLRIRDWVKVFRFPSFHELLDSTDSVKFYSQMKCLLVLRHVCRLQMYLIYLADSTTVLCSLVCCQARFRCYGSPTRHFPRYRCCCRQHSPWLIRRAVCSHSGVVSLGLCFGKRHLASKRIVFSHHWSCHDCLCSPLHSQIRCKLSSRLDSGKVACSQLDSYGVQVTWRKKPASVVAMYCLGSYLTLEDLC